MRPPLRFGIAVCLVCSVFLCAQGKPSPTEQTQQPSATSDSTSQAPSADDHATPSTPPGVTAPVRPMKVCSEKNPPPCLTPARAVFAPDPEYSEEAREAKREGTCVLWLVVGTDGKAHDIKVARTLGFGLDEKAIEAVKRWRFQPAQKDGKPVLMQINVEVRFHLNAGAPRNKFSFPALPDITVSPVSAKVASGGEQKFSATVPGAANVALIWSVSGSGCAVGACGSISTGGLYTAPVNVPNPTTVTVTATLASDPTRKSSATVTIQPSPSR